MRIVSELTEVRASFDVSTGDHQARDRRGSFAVRKENSHAGARHFAKHFAP